MQAAELKEIPILSSVPVSELEPWAEAARVCSLSPRDIAPTVEPHAPCLGLIREGMLAVTLASRRGEARVVAVADPTRCYGLQCLHPGLRMVETAYALVPTELIYVPGEVVRRSLARGGELGSMLGAAAASLLAEMADELVRATTLDVKSRAAVALLRLSDRLGCSTVALTQEQLAAMVGTRRGTLALVLAGLRNDEIIDTRYRRIRVLDRRRLLGFCEDAYPSAVDLGLEARPPLVGVEPR